MELKFDIEEVTLEAERLSGTLRAVTDAAYNGGYGADEYEMAFETVCGLAQTHYKNLKELTNKAFELQDKNKYPVSEDTHLCLRVKIPVREGDGMKRHDKRTNETLAKVVERFNVHSQEMKSDNHIVSEAAAIMHNIELWEIWALTQE